MKKGKFFEAMAALLFIILAFILYGMAMTSGPSNIVQETNYAGKAKLVLEIISLNTTDHTPDLAFPDYYNVHALHSSDPAIKEGSDYKLHIDEVEKGYFGCTGAIPNEFVRGTVIGIDDYGFNATDMPTYAGDLYYIEGDEIIVTVGADPKDKNAWDNAWKQKIKIYPMRSFLPAFMASEHEI